MPSRWRNLLHIITSGPSSGPGAGKNQSLEGPPQTNSKLRGRLEEEGLRDRPSAGNVWEGVGEDAPAPITNCCRRIRRSQPVGSLGQPHRAPTAPMRRCSTALATERSPMACALHSAVVDPTAGAVQSPVSRQAGDGTIQLPDPLHAFRCPHDWPVDHQGQINCPRVVA
jgi:hypothetical protein